MESIKILKVSVLFFLCTLCATSFCTEGKAEPYELNRYEKEYSNVHIEPANMDGKPGIAVVFEGTDGLHYYARAETATAPGNELQVNIESVKFKFAEAIFPKWKVIKDPLGKDVEVFAGNFKVFMPFDIERSQKVKGDIEVKVSGQACTDEICLMPAGTNFKIIVDLSKSNNWPAISIEQEQKVSSSKTAKTNGDERTAPAILPFSTSIYLILAVLAGISINIMPCVLPVIPLIMMRLIKNAEESSEKRIVAGGTFCVGIILFFVMFAVISALINITTGTVIDINSLFRYPTAVIILFLAILFFALVLLDVIVLALPSSVAGKQGGGNGVVGSLGMGFFAGVLSTPCSGALIGFVLVWAQTQPLLVSSAAIILMGVGMALPYAVIILIPKLLDKVPKPGTWMEIFKKTCGFLLLYIAVKITLAALPKDRLLSVLMYGIIFSFCVWMWGKWVTFSTPRGRKWTVRLIALIIGITCGAFMLPSAELPQEQSIAWQKYDAQVIEKAVENKQPVVMKFTADWCTNCKVVDKKVYHDPAIIKLIKQKGILAIKADTTLENYRATQDFRKIYGEAGNIPVTIVLLPDSDPIKIRGIFDKQKLIDIIDNGKKGDILLF